MKKTYNSPTVKVVEVKAQSILAGSDYNTSSASSMSSGSFGARGASFDDWGENED